MNAAKLTPLNIHPRLKRIATVSNILKWLCFVGVLLFGIGVLLLLVLWITTGSTVGDTAKTKIPYYLPKYHFLGNLCHFSNIVIVLLNTWFAFKLFRLYSHGQLFSPGNISYLRKLAVTFLLIGIVAALETFMENPQSPKDYNDAVAVVDKLPAFWGAVIYFCNNASMALVVLFFAWIMDEGRKIQEEQELTV
jgi:hypothetical protein